MGSFKIRHIQYFYAETRPVGMASNIDESRFAQFKRFKSIHVAINSILIKQFDLPSCEVSSILCPPVTYKAPFAERKAK